MKRPEHPTPESLCELIVAEATERGVHRNDFITGALSLSKTTWVKIKNKKLPDFSKAGVKKPAWVSILTRLCTYLELDIDACFEACGLPKDEVAIRKAQNRLKEQNEPREELHLTEDDIQELLQIAKNVRKPLPLSFVAQYLALKCEEEAGE